MFEIFMRRKKSDFRKPTVEKQRKRQSQREKFQPVKKRKREG